MKFYFISSSFIIIFITFAFGYIRFAFGYTSLKAQHHSTCKDRLASYAKKRPSFATNHNLLKTQKFLSAFTKKNNDQLTEKNFNEIANFLTKENLVIILNEVVQSPSLLQYIAQNSYKHVLGFTKIVLMEDLGGQNWELRLHLWPPKLKSDSITAEAKHVHLFDFVSRIISGKLEDHRYNVDLLSKEEQLILHKFSKAMQLLSTNIQEKVIHQLDYFELYQSNFSSSLKRSSLKNLSLEHQNQNTVKKYLKNTLNMSIEEIIKVSQLMKKYSNFLDEKGIEHYRLVSENKLQNIRVDTHTTGSIYFSPVQEAHRLFVDNQNYTSTFVFVGPFHKNLDSGGFKRYYNGEQKKLAQQRNFLSPTELYTLLNEYLNFLRSEKI